MPLSPREAERHQDFKSDDEDQEDEELINQYFDGDQRGKRKRVSKRSLSTVKSPVMSPNTETSFFRPGGDEHELLQKMVSIAKRYEVSIHKLNRLRFESHREDREDTGLVTTHFFKSM